MAGAKKVNDRKRGPAKKLGRKAKAALAAEAAAQQAAGRR